MPTEYLITTLGGSIGLLVCAVLALPTYLIASNIKPPHIKIVNSLLLLSFGFFMFGDLFMMAQLFALHHGFEKSREALAKISRLLALSPCHVSP